METKSYHLLQTHGAEHGRAACASVRACSHVCMGECETLCRNVDVCERGSVQGVSVPKRSPGGRCSGEVGLQQEGFRGTEFTLGMALHPPLSYLGLDPAGSR